MEGITITLDEFLKFCAECRHLRNTQPSAELVAAYPDAEWGEGWYVASALQIAIPRVYNAMHDLDMMQGTETDVATVIFDVAECIMH